MVAVTIAMAMIHCQVLLQERKARKWRHPKRFIGCRRRGSVVVATQQPKQYATVAIQAYSQPSHVLCRIHLFDVGISVLIMQRTNGQ